MALEDREYLRQEARRYGGGGGAARLMPQGLSLSVILIIINCVIAFLTFGQNALANALISFGIMQPEAVWNGQIWRLWTATYLHAGMGHLFFNMLGLYFFGPPLEQRWGPRQFFLAYTVGGVAGNIVLTGLGALPIMSAQTLGLGASGSILTLVGAVAVLFPQSQVLLFFIIPMKVRTFALVFGALYVLNIFSRGDNWGGDVAHLTGLIVGAWWAASGGISLSGKHNTQIPSDSFLGKLFGGGGQRQRGKGAWDQKIERRRKDQLEIDRILSKVHQQGVGSLTRRERKTLEEDTRRRRDEEKGMGL